MHSSIWYICANGFANILEFLVDNTFGIRDEIIEAVEKNDESPSLLYIATYYQRESITKLLMKEPFKWDENKTENGLSILQLKTLRKRESKKEVKKNCLEITDLNVNTIIKSCQFSYASH